MFSPGDEGTADATHKMRSMTVGVGGEYGLPLLPLLAGSQAHVFFAANREACGYPEKHHCCPRSASVWVV